jgi:Fe-S cluster assembly protein SufD
MNVNVKKSAAELSLEAQVDAMLATAVGGQAEALGNLKQSGIPHRRQEPWVYTDLRNLMGDSYPPAEPAAGTPEIDSLMDPALAALDTCRIVRINGYLNDELSDLDALPSGLTIARQDHAPAASDAAPHFIADVVTAFSSEIVTLTVAPGAAIEKPIQLINHTIADAPVASYARTTVNVGEGGAVTLLESHGGHGTYQASSVLDISLGRNAVATHIRHQNEDLAALHLALIRLDLGAQSKWHSFTLTEGARVSRSEMVILFKAEGARAYTNGAKLLRGEQHGDTTIVVDHAVPNCDSEEVIKSVLEDKARGIFQGKVIVRPGAHGTDGRQSSNALLLSDMAEMDTKPELEIYNDDVQCAHGATVGEIDPDMLFYMRSRGIPEKQAEALLIQAHVGGAMDIIADDNLRNAVSEISARWLGERRFT